MIWLSAYNEISSWFVIEIKECLSDTGTWSCSSKYFFCPLVYCPSICCVLRFNVNKMETLKCLKCSRSKFYSVFVFENLLIFFVQLIKILKLRRNTGNPTEGRPTVSQHLNRCATSITEPSTQPVNSIFLIEFKHPANLSTKDCNHPVMVQHASSVAMQQPL